MKRIFLTLLLSALFGAAHASYTVIDTCLTDSEIFPGTVHTFKVVVPDAYDPASPAALYLGLDGVLCRAPQVIDSLMAAGEMPVTVSVYLQPGYIPGDSATVLRYNRSNEFDATDGRFASFIENELLPAVESLATTDGRRISLSADPADRMIFGLSSGGIAAFNAAWHRPDLFGKVYSGCGTFVPMRGGNDLEAIVRKHEPLPLRVFLQDGYTDSWNQIFGSWYEANRQLASALEWAGYDCAFDWAEGGHSVVRTSQIFPQVMTWMWRGEDDSIRARPTPNGLLAQLLIEGEGWLPAGTAAPAAMSAAPAEAVYPDGSLVAVAVPGSNYVDQYIIGKDGERLYGQRYYWLHTYDNAALDIPSMAFDADGWLWVMTRAGIQICDQNGRVRGILRLPLGFDASCAALSIVDGSVTISDGRAAYTRRLNVKAPRGVRPASQGAA